MSFPYQIPKDKILHLVCGFGIAIAFGLLASIIAGAGKEAFDKFWQGERWDNLDLLATVVGGIFGSILFYALFGIPTISSSFSDQAIKAAFFSSAYLYLL